VGSGLAVTRELRLSDALGVEANDVPCGCLDSAGRGPARVQAESSRLLARLTSATTMIGGITTTTAMTASVTIIASTSLLP
jgi:hypothetical protein